MKENNIAILIVSCDKYSDLWDYFFKMFNIFWPDCKYPIYIGSNTVRCNKPNVYSICIGEDKSWAENVKLMLDNINETHIILLLEDFFLEKLVDQDGIEKVYKYMLDQDFDCVRLCPDPAPGKTINKKLKLGIINMGAPYCCSTQPAIWKKETLKKLLKAGYSAWDFEKKNSLELKGSPHKFAGANVWYIKRHNGVERGKYYTSTIKLLRKNGIDVQVGNRGVINNLTILKRAYHVFYRSVQYARAKLYRNK